MAELDMSQYLDLFVQEAEEQLETLERETLGLEEEPSSERLQSIFRAAHTLKGSSRAMGFANFAELTHEMENVLDALRNDRLDVGTRVADALLAANDALGQMVESIRSGEGDAHDVEALVTELRTILNAGPAKTELQTAAPDDAPALPHEVEEALRAASVQAPVYRVHVRLAEDCVMKFARAFMLVSAIEEAGELLLTTPDREALEEERFEDTFDLYFQTERPTEPLAEELGKVGEVQEISLSAWRAEPQKTDAPKQAAPKAEAQKAAPTRKTETGQTVRVDVARLDALMNLVGELVIDRTRIAQIGSDLSQRLNDDGVEALTETVSHIERITGDLQDQIMKARMMPIEVVFNRFPRVVRDLANKLDKKIHLDIEGGATELDRSVIEVIGDPLLHILRNSVDHGVESPEKRLAAGKPEEGVIRLTANHQENHIVITIEDDGGGIDPAIIKAKAVEKGQINAETAARMTDREALQLIFASGLSTAKEVSEVSGRGVGMDIVRSNLQTLGGMIDVESEVGQGTRTSLRLPLTLAIIRGLLVRCCGNVYVLPLGSVVETLFIENDSIQTVRGCEVILIRGVTTPLVRARQVFAETEEPPQTDGAFVVVLGLAEQRVGLVVDELIGEQEVVIKSLSRYVGDVGGFSGATILGDGNVALIVDVNGLVKAA